MNLFQWHLKKGMSGYVSLERCWVRPALLQQPVWPGLALLSSAAFRPSQRGLVLPSELVVGPWPDQACASLPPEGARAQLAESQGLRGHLRPWFCWAACACPQPISGAWFSVSKASILNGTSCGSPQCALFRMPLKSARSASFPSITILLLQRQ